MTRPRRQARLKPRTGVALSPLARAVYRLLRQRVGLADPRITYKELACLLRDGDDAFEHLTHRSRELYAVLWGGRRLPAPRPAAAARPGRARRHTPPGRRLLRGRPVRPPRRTHRRLAARPGRRAPDHLPGRP